MIGAAQRWFRRVAPPAWAIALLLLLYGMVEGIYLWLQSWAPWEAARVALVRNDAVIGAAAAYGAFRAVAFHPLFRASYRQWLSLTPWTYRQPLPLGPVNLVWQDVAAVAGLTLLLHDVPWLVWLRPPAAFLAAYLASVCLTLWITKTWREAYALAFGLGLAVWLLPGRWEAVAAVLAGLICIAWLGTRRSLMRFPWDDATARLGDAWASKRDRAAPQVGWPFSHLHPQPVHPRRDVRHGIVRSFLLGWWVYALFHSVPVHHPDGLPTMSLIYGLGCGVLLLMRIRGYFLAYWPPISLWGRLWTGRWIIPDYDRALAAPLIGAAAAVAVPLALLRMEAPPAPTFAVSLVLVALACLAMSPDLEHWRLTGAYRLAPPWSKARSLSGCDEDAPGGIPEADRAAPPPSEPPPAKERSRGKPRFLQSRERPPPAPRGGWRRKEAHRCRCESACLALAEP